MEGVWVDESLCFLPQLEWKVKETYMGCLGVFWRPKNEEQRRRILILSPKLRPTVHYPNRWTRVQQKSLCFCFGLGWTRVHPGVHQRGLWSFALCQTLDSGRGLDARPAWRPGPVSLQIWSFLVLRWCFLISPLRSCKNTIETKDKEWKIKLVKSKNTLGLPPEKRYV